MAMTTREIVEHLKERGMSNPYLYNISTDGEVITFPLYDFSKRYVGYQNYRPFAERNHHNVQLARYFTYLPRGVYGYFGLETLAYSGPLYCVEGVFKAGKLHSLGFAAVSLMGTGVYKSRRGWDNIHRSQLDLLRRPYICIGDNDAAGRAMAGTLGGFTSPRDLDEMSDNEILELLNENN